MSHTNCAFMACPPGSGSACIPVAGYGQGILFLPDLTTPAGAAIKNKFEALLSSPLTTPGARCTLPPGTPNPIEVQWRNEWTAFSQLFFGDRLILDSSTCAVTAAEDPMATEATVPYSAAAASIVNIIHGVDCSGDHCEMGELSHVQGTVEQCAASMVLPNEYDTPTVSPMYVRDAFAGAIIGLAHQLTGNVYPETRVECTSGGYNPLKLVGSVGFAADGTGLEGPFACTVPSGNKDIAYAWNTTLNTVWRLYNRTCNCPSQQPTDYKGGVSAKGVNMCSGGGICGTAEQPYSDTGAVPGTTPPTVPSSSTCECGPGLVGPDCSQSTPTTCPTLDGITCGPNGTCDTSTMYCACNVGWTGLTCSIPACPVDADGNSCSGNGTCERNVCNCNQGFTGADCSIKNGDPAPAPASKTGTGSGTKTGQEKLKKLMPLLLVVGAVIIVGSMYFFFFRARAAFNFNPSTAQAMAATQIYAHNP